MDDGAYAQAAGRLLAAIPVPDRLDDLREFPDRARARLDRRGRPNWAYLIEQAGRSGDPSTLPTIGADMLRHCAEASETATSARKTVEESGLTIADRRIISDALTGVETRLQRMLDDVRALESRLGSAPTGEALRLAHDDAAAIQSRLDATHKLAVSVVHRLKRAREDADAELAASATEFVYVLGDSAPEQVKEARDEVLELACRRTPTESKRDTLRTTLLERLAEVASQPPITQQPKRRDGDRDELLRTAKRFQAAHVSMVEAAQHSGMEKTARGDARADQLGKMMRLGKQLANAIRDGGLRELPSMIGAFHAYCKRVQEEVCDAEKLVAGSALAAESSVVTTELKKASELMAEVVVPNSRKLADRLATGVHSLALASAVKVVAAGIQRDLEPVLGALRLAYVNLDTSNPKLNSDLRLQRELATSATEFVRALGDRAPRRVKVSRDAVLRSGLSPTFDRPRQQMRREELFGALAKQARTVIAAAERSPKVALRKDPQRSANGTAARGPLGQTNEGSRPRAGNLGRL